MENETNPGSGVEKRVPANPMTKAKAKRERAKKRALAWAVKSGTHGESVDDYIHRLKITTAPSTEQSPARLTERTQAPSLGTQPTTPHPPSAKRKASSTPNRENPSKAFKPSNPVLNVYRRDRNEFHRRDRALVSKALISVQLENKENPALAWCGKTRVAGSCLILEVLSSALTTIKSAINEMADYFAVEADEPVHLHSLMGTIAPTLKDSLGDLPTLLSIASDGKTQASDYNCTRGTVFLRGRLGFWLQVTPVALEWINSMGSLVWICGEPVKLKLEKSLYVPSRAEQAAAMETEENAPEKEAEEEEEEASMEFDAYEHEQLAMHSGQQRPLNSSFSDMSLKSMTDKTTLL